MTSSSRLQQTRRKCALWVAVGYCCLTLVVPFHQHLHAKSVAATSSSASEISVLSGSDGQGISATPAVIHCAACEWEAIVGSQTAQQFVFQPQPRDITFVTAAPVRALLSLAFTSSSRGPPQA